MIETFSSDIINSYFKEIRDLLYKADGRTDPLPENLLDFKKVNIEEAEEIRKLELNKNSLIKLSPNMSVSEFIDYRSGHFDYNSEPDSYDKDFLKLPINTIEISDEIEIDCYFYKYSFLDKNDTFLQINAPNISARNFLMRRSDFLYMTFYSKFISISDNYQKCLKRGRKQFQLNKKVDEENILHHFIKYYNDILNINDKQLEIFEHVKTTKQVADLYTKILIEFLTLKLKTLLPETDRLYIVQPQGRSVDGKIEEKVVVELPENFSLIENGFKSEALNIKQTAVLFYYLRKHKATIDYSDKSLSKLVHYLTGHSANNLRQKSGFGNITEILRSSKNGVEKNNLKKVKELLENILLDIDKEIDK